MALTIPQAVQEYFFNKKGEYYKGADFIEAYKILAYNVLNKEEKITKADGTLIDVFPGDGFKNPNELDNERRKLDDEMYKYACTLEELNPELAKSIKSVTVGDGRSNVKFSLTEKMEILPDSYTKEQKIRNDIACLMDLPSNLDLSHRDLKNSIVNVAKEIKSTKPSFLRWIFQRQKYNQMKETYLDLKGKFESVVTSKFMPIVLTESFGQSKTYRGFNFASENRRAADALTAELKEEVKEIDNGSLFRNANLQPPVEAVAVEANIDNLERDTAIEEEQLDSSREEVQEVRDPEPEESLEDYLTND